MSKYDWSNVPVGCDWLAMDSDGEIFGFKGVPSAFDDYMWYGLKPIRIAHDPIKDYWKDSLEERPK